MSTQLKSQHIAFLVHDLVSERIETYKNNRAEKQIRHEENLRSFGGDEEDILNSRVNTLRVDARWERNQRQIENSLIDHSEFMQRNIERLVWLLNGNGFCVTEKSVKKALIEAGYEEFKDQEFPREFGDENRELLNEVGTVE